SHLALFRRTIGDLRAFVLSQDLIYVGGGNTFNMLALWRAHGLESIFREAYDAGVVLAGISAGALCWFEGGPTDSFGPLAPMRCLGFAPGSLGVHYDADAQRRPVLHDAIARGEIGAGYGVDEGAALHLVDERLVEVVASRPHATAYRVEMQGDRVVEQPLAARFLGG
ncbi:MAG TPA: peptidase E, partial [Oscillatoriaceae cyanobacterium]